jgi:imidazoleglycerol phosphate synthase glutamine amidotransferase subunit HisH
MTCDIEIYKNPENAYFVYSYTLKQTDVNRRHNKRTMGNLNYGNNSVALMEYKKELEKCK